MITIPITSLPNQSFSIQLGNDNYDIVIRSCNFIMAVDLTRNNVPILTGQRVVAGTPVIPYTYLESGNFLFITANEEYPDYTQFGLTQLLVFTSAAELEAIRAGT